VANETRYQVFVSSTYTDLASERQAAILALLQLDALPAGMELFPAANDEAWVLIKRVIDESDYYLLVVGGRYGSVDAEGLSYTEKEYDYAESRQKPVMAFLHGDPGKIPFENSEANPEAREKLNTFRERVKHAKHVKYWTSAEDLAGKIALSFSTFVRTYPAVGWVRGDAGDSPETLRKLTSAQEEIAGLRGQLHKSAVEPPPEAKGLADRDERLTVGATIRIKINNLTDDSEISPNQTLEGKLSLSWNEILSALGPAMLDEASQQDLSTRFKNAVEEVNRSRAGSQARRWLLGAGRENYKDSNGNAGSVPQVTTSLVVPDHYFETALLQLEALGIIENGSRKRPVADHFVYWTLTPWGRTRLTRLRAVRAGADRPPDKDDFDLEPNGEGDNGGDLQPGAADGVKGAAVTKTRTTRRSRSKART
jgi:hypothetical protein